MTYLLEDPCQFLKGVGPRRAVSLDNLGIQSVGDLLLHAPRAYMDRQQISCIRDLVPGENTCIRVRIESAHARPTWRGRRSLQATVSDDTGRLKVTWFGFWMRSAMRPGRQMILAGSVVRRRGHLEMRQPEFDFVDEESDSQETLNVGRIVPFYPLTQGISQKWLRGLIARTLETHLASVEEFLPEGVLGDLLPRRQALETIHFPESNEKLEEAKRRFKMEELFLLELLLARRRHRSTTAISGIPLDLTKGLHEAYRQSLPFDLTGAQDRVLGEIYADLVTNKRMQRLVQGDVGSGKTVLAVMTLLVAIGNGYQGAFMVPTESLALQHAERLLPTCMSLGIRAGVLVGSQTDRQKEELRGRMKSGDVDLVIGTHALIQQKVEWARLGVAIVDEQQRFGVLQRGALQETRSQKTEGAPHVLILSATPIPRSLALTLFGDLDVSRLDEKPPGRQVVSTHLVPVRKRRDLWKFVRQELENGNQAFAVLPLIEESENLPLRAATDEFEELRAGPLKGYKVGLLHGRLSGKDKEKVFKEFSRGDIQVLVSTTVVEVGIDVRQASIMIIYHPDRFGLAQLHQLRGRVGRGSEKSYCFLLSSGTTSPEAEDRLQGFCKTDDGFLIAELDLELRGPGDFMGTRQHGLPTLRFADLSRDLDLLQCARTKAFDLIKKDPNLEAVENRKTLEYLETHYKEHEMLAEIG